MVLYQLNCWVKRLGKVYEHLKSSSEFQGPVGVLHDITSELNINTLKEERARAGFLVDEMACYINGGREVYEAFRSLQSQLEKYVFGGSLLFRPYKEVNASVDERRRMTFARATEAIKIISRLKDADEISWVFEILDPSMEIIINVHFFLFRHAIMNNGSKEQVLKWEKSILDCSIYGCFAMTELGTGSCVSGIETVVTFSKSTREFVIHTPTLTATKWWIGAASDIATHAAVYAHLQVDEVDYGVQVFIVPIRSLENHRILPGIKIGDCGEKMGLNGVGNGWIQFDHVHIPLENLMSRFTRVDFNGRVVKNTHSNITYSALIGIRTRFISYSANILKHAMIIAIRYSLVRRQFRKRHSELQIQLLDYSSQAANLMPFVASSYAMVFAWRAASLLYSKAKEHLAEDRFDWLHEVHVLSAGLKSHCTWITHTGLDICRQCCGGHGYSVYSLISFRQSDWSVMTTLDGTNVVLCQQLVYDLLRYFSRFTKKLEPMLDLEHELAAAVNMNYLGDMSRILGSRMEMGEDEDWLGDLKKLVDIWAYIPVRLLYNLGITMQEGANDDFANDLSSLEAQKVAKAHTYYFMIVSFYNAYEAAPTAIRAALGDLLGLFILSNTEEYLELLLEEQFIQIPHAKNFRRLLSRAIEKTRANALAYVDSFGFTDFLVGSPLGKYDGDIYGTYFGRVVNDNPPRTVPPWYETTIKPFLKMNG